MPEPSARRPARSCWRRFSSVCGRPRRCMTTTRFSPIRCRWEACRETWSGISGRIASRRVGGGKWTIAEGDATDNGFLRRLACIWPRSAKKCRALCHESGVVPTKKTRLTGKIRAIE